MLGMQIRVRLTHYCLIRPQLLLLLAVLPVHFLDIAHDVVRYGYAPLRVYEIALSVEVQLTRGEAALIDVIEHPADAPKDCK